MISKIGSPAYKFLYLTPYFFSFFLIFSCRSVTATDSSDEAPESNQPEYITRTIVGYDKMYTGRFYNNVNLFSEGWDTLSHVQFWQEIMNLHLDSILLNIADHRQPLFRLHTSDWTCQTPEEKELYKRMICVSGDLSATTSIYATTGKKHFFQFRKVLSLIPASIEVFQVEGTDPWFAQTILLIESPGKTDASSYAGARGAFQLMPGVARRHGLTVNNHHDDRTDLLKSAAGAARHIKRICIPEARRLLGLYNVNYSEKDLWFRLLVMHIYHAGAGNVGAALEKINPAEGGMDIIRKLWRTEAKGFKNESQNYSQIALAAMVSFDRLINAESENDTLFLIRGERMLSDLRDSRRFCVDTLGYYIECYNVFGDDLVEGVIPVNHYLRSISNVEKELMEYCRRNNIRCASMSVFEKSERYSELASRLLVKRKSDDAIVILEKALELNPLSVSSYNRIMQAYRQKKNQEKVNHYSARMEEVLKNPGNYIR